MSRTGDPDHPAHPDHLNCPDHLNYPDYPDFEGSGGRRRASARA
ncbi:hypothetical protein ACFU99_36970 [Streptomyces sp. NPDC057654]